MIREFELVAELLCGVCGLMRGRKDGPTIRVNGAVYDWLRLGHARAARVVRLMFGKQVV